MYTHVDGNCDVLFFAIMLCVINLFLPLMKTAFPY